jgi:hypothetical protein
MTEAKSGWSLRRSNKRVQADAAVAAGNRARNWLLCGTFEMKHTFGEIAARLTRSTLGGVAGREGGQVWPGMTRGGAGCQAEDHANAVRRWRWCWSRPV